MRFLRPQLEEQRIILIEPATLREAERLIESCESCNPEGAEILFDYILDRVTGSDPSVTDYICGTAGEVSELQARYPREDADRTCIEHERAQTRSQTRSSLG